MVEIIIKTVLSWPLMIVDVVVLNNYLKSKIKIFSLKNIIIMLSLATIPALLHNDNYSILLSFLNFLLSFIAFKLIFEKSMTITLLDSVFIIILNFIANMVCSVILIPFFTIEQIRSVGIGMVLANVIVVVITYLISKLRIVKKIYDKLISDSTLKTKTIELIFLLLVAFGFVALGYNMYKHFEIGYGELVNIVIIIILSALFLINIIERSNYNKLSYEYDEIFKCVKEFETWVEKEQLNRHEYKNQLAVLRIMTKEKKVKDKIDSIISDNIDIKNDQISSLQNLPSNGLKGLLYYKTAVANRKKINLLFDISANVKNKLSKLKEKDLKVLCRLIGIYFDNAIEEASITKKKLLTMEIYKLKNNIEFVITNSLKTKKDLDRIKEKGVSTKGKNRGHGLYFASKMINNNRWLKSNTEIKDDFYIQRLTLLDLD